MVVYSNKNETSLIFLPLFMRTRFLIPAPLSLLITTNRGQCGQILTVISLSSLKTNPHLLFERFP